MKAYRNDLILQAAKGQLTSRNPVWLMRQAGRVLPEYRASRAKAGSFFGLLKNPALAAEVTIQPIEILQTDAAIIFSDILVIPEALGLPYEMVEAKGPFFPKTIAHEKDMDALSLQGVSTLDYVYKAIALTTEKLAGEVPLIGFAGAPFTIFCYMTEGKGSKTFSLAKKMLYTSPALSHRLLHLITEASILYLKEQVKAGAAMLQLFDSWAGVLSPEDYLEYATPYIRRICDALKAEMPEVPITVFAKGAYYALDDFAASNCDVIGLDWQTDISFARLKTKGKTLQGNLDPSVLYASPENIRNKTKSMLQKAHGTPFIANLGHGLYPDIEASHVKVFIETVKNFSHENTGQ
jgi:uroporphyrinogen decarboxylase